jgi:hypothetical protein
MLTFSALASDDSQMPPRGSLETTSAEYRLEAKLDPEIFTALHIEHWARLDRPAQLEQGKKYPLIVFLHGNHQTCGIPRPDGLRVDNSCEYTWTGVCPQGSIVVPNHLGYSYVTELLASHGYLVLSINANRGINCGPELERDIGLNLVRGRLILSHLRLLSAWNQGFEPTASSLGFSLKGKIDFSNVGLFGHSRGGEGVRAAYALYQDRRSPWPRKIADSVRFKAIFELGAVDGQTSRVLNALDVPWVQLTPSCDGDVRLLDGLRPFDRMMDGGHRERAPSMKSIFYVKGANHNFFNTEWHRADSPGCHVHEPIFKVDHSPEQDSDGQPVYHYFGSSPKQRAIAAHAISTHMLNYVKRSDDLPQMGGSSASQDSLFDPAFKLSAEIKAIAPVERSFVSTPNAEINPVLENFSADVGRNMHGPSNDHSRVTVEHGTDPSLYEQVIRTAIISWTDASAKTYFQTNWSSPGDGVAFDQTRTLSFRISRRPQSVTDQFVDLNIALVDSEGRLSRQSALSRHVLVEEPGGFGMGRAVLQTVKIPISTFRVVNLKKIRGLRFTFNRTKSGVVLLDEIRVDGLKKGGFSSSSVTEGQRSLAQSAQRSQQNLKNAKLLPTQNLNGNRLVIQSLQGAFPVGGALLSFHVDGARIGLASFPDPSDLSKIEFRLTPAERTQIERTTALEIRVGNSPEWRVIP